MTAIEKKFTVTLTLQGGDADAGMLADDIANMLNFCRTEFGFSATDDETETYVANIDAEPQS